MFSGYTEMCASYHHYTPTTERQVITGSKPEKKEKEKRN